MSATRRDGDYITLGEAAKHVPHRPHAGTVWRWARRGVLSRSGHAVRLQHVRIGGRVYTTAAWLHEFFAQLAHADIARWQHNNRLTRHERQLRYRKAEETLEEAGL